MKLYEVRENAGVRFIEFKHIAETGKFIHGFSTRIGGVSSNPFDTLNLGFETIDPETQVNENRKRFLKALHIEKNMIRQLINLVHGNIVVNYDEISQNTYPIDADGIVTDRAEIPLVTTFADCIPIFLADPVVGACGIVHAGWRGTFDSVASAAVLKMQKDFTSKPENILAGIGPGISRCCFEVGRDVADAFMAKFGQWKDLMIESSNYKRWFIDLSGLNLRILIGSGLRENNAVVADLCTFCRQELFFSYRRDGRVSGRMAALIAKKPENMEV